MSYQGNRESVLSDHFRPRALLFLPRMRIDNDVDWAEQNNDNAALGGTYRSVLRGPTNQLRTHKICDPGCLCAPGLY